MMMSSNYDNNGQYSRHSILRYEKIFGDGFVSSGGLGLTKSFFERLDLPQGAKVLDIGSGLGGAAFYLADKVGATVVGVDLSSVMVEIASERTKLNGYNSVSFKLADVRDMEWPENHFDLIWSRDTLLHVPNKDELFVQLQRWLKPGGHIMISDYAKGVGEGSEGFQTYVRNSGYHLLDVESYGDLLRDAGFVDVVSDNWSTQFVEILRAEQGMLQSNRSEFLKDFSEEDLQYLHERWERKVQYCLEGDMQAGLWYGTKA
ncbi:MAG: methyltransferase domain-containing protein [Deltaproteobacteria bacterium]|nr:MAG: methyltransferase domain-containing protein [Deltaproteobacteria bacterium]